MTEWKERLCPHHPLSRWGITAFSAETLSPTLPPLLDLLQSPILSKSRPDKRRWELSILVLTTSGMEGSPGWERDVSGQKGQPLAFCSWGGLQEDPDSSTGVAGSFYLRSGGRKCLLPGDALAHQWDLCGWCGSHLLLWQAPVLPMKTVSLCSLTWSGQCSASSSLGSCAGLGCLLLWIAVCHLGRLCSGWPRVERVEVSLWSTLPWPNLEHKKLSRCSCLPDPAPLWVTYIGSWRS